MNISETTGQSGGLAIVAEFGQPCGKRGFPA